MKLKMVTPDPGLLKLPYYHPHFTDVNQVCDVLTPYVNQDGTYLLRDSKSRPGTLTISVMHQHQVNHFNVEFKAHHGYLLYEKYFKTVKELVEYYSQHDIPNKEHVKHIRLCKPVYSTRMVKNPLSPAAVQGSASDAVARRPLPRQQSLDIIDTNGLQQSHPPRRVQSERIGSGVPVLPLPPTHKKTLPSRVKNLFIKSRSQSESSEGSLSGDLTPNRRSDPLLSPADRPALPLPRQARNPTRHDSECLYRAPSASAADFNNPQDNIYTDPRAEVDQTEVLVHQLRIDEELRAQFEMCHCGIRVIDSELPQGWTVHRSQEPDTKGRLFYVAADNTTSWTLPASVIDELTLGQRQTLSRLRDTGIYRLGAGKRDS